jgi:hypothetical protein
VKAGFIARQVVVICMTAACMDNDGHNTVVACMNALQSKTTLFGEKGVKIGNIS